MKNYHIKLTFDINIAPWRIHDPNDIKNHEWSLSVFDRNLGEWINLADCTRPGESSRIARIDVLNDENQIVNSNNEPQKKSKVNKVKCPQDHLVPTHELDKHNLEIHTLAECTVCVYECAGTLMLAHHYQTSH